MFKTYSEKNAHDEFESQWLATDFYEKLEKCKKSKEIRSVVKKYANKKSKILEAGCGVGQWVKFYHDLGYDIEGVDFVKSVIKKIKSVDADLKVIHADCTNLPYKNDSIDLYLSFGVIEHMEQGPDDILKEAHRVIKKDGFGYISVPNQESDMYFKVFNKKQDTTKVFFEYAYTKQDYLDVMARNKFEIVEFIPYGYFISLRKFKFLCGKKPYSLNWLGRLFERYYVYKKDMKHAWIIAAVVRPVK